MTSHWQHNSATQAGLKPSNVSQETVYSLGWEDMGVVVKLEEWTLVFGLALGNEDGVNIV